MILQQYVLASVCIAHGALAATHTLYQYSATTTETGPESWIAEGTLAGVSALGVDAGGSTTYVRTYVLTRGAVVEAGGATSTFLSEPKTDIATIRADAEGYHHFMSPNLAATREADCRFLPSATGAEGWLIECVDLVVHAGEGAGAGASTQTVRTRTGIAAPYHTVVSDEGAGDEGDDPGGAQESSAGRVLPRIAILLSAAVTVMMPLLVMGAV